MTGSQSPGNTQAKKELSNEQGTSKRGEKRWVDWVSATSEKHTGAKGICVCAAFTANSVRHKNLLVLLK